MNCFFMKTSEIAAESEKKDVTVFFHAAPAAASVCTINKKFDDVDMKAGSSGSISMITDLQGNEIKDMTKCPGDKFKMTCVEDKKAVDGRRLAATKVDCRKIPKYPA